MKHRTGLAAGALALALTFAGTGSASAAAVMVYTYKGTVNSVSESGGGNLFGAIIPHQTSFTAVFTRNDNAPGATQLAGGDPDAAFSQLYGDQTTSPVLARLEVGGLIFNIGSTPGFPTHSGGQSQRKFSDGYEDFGISSTDFSFSSSGCCEFIKRKSIQFYAYGTGGDYLANADYHSLDTLNSADTPLLNWQGYASFDDYYYDSARGDSFGTFSSIYFTPTSVTVSDAVAVPEPGTWALMISGFGMAGAMLRRRRRMAVAA